jgi:hypothetical protein
VRSLIQICLFVLLLPNLAQAGAVFTPVTSWRLTYTHSGLAIAPNGTVYAVDDYVGVVDYYSPQGVWLGSWTTSDAPQDIAVDHAGFVYVVYRTGRVEKFTASGVHVTDFTDAREGTAASIAVDKAGHIYVGRYGTVAPVAEFDPLGNFIREFPSLGSLAVEVDDAGNVYTVGPQYLAKFSPNGQLLGQLTVAGACQDLYMTDLALDTNGHVILANFISSNVLFVSVDLECLESWTMEAPPYKIVQQTLPVHLAFDPSGYVYVQDVMFDRIVKYRYDATTPTLPLTWGQLKTRYR